MKNITKKIGIGIAGLCLLAGLTGCSNSKPEMPSKFRTTNYGSHYKGAEIFANIYHKGAKKIAEDLDFDGDGMNDLYLINNDGTVYHTISRELINGKDTINERTWFKTDPYMIKYLEENKNKK